MSPSGLRISGYASLFGEADLSGDVVHAGAFAQSLARKSAPLPLLVGHNPAARAGSWHLLREEARGLWVEGLVEPHWPGAGLAGRLIGQGTDGLSIGYTTRRAKPRPGGGRELLVIDLWEVSIVTRPMAPRARLAAVPAL